MNPHKPSPRETRFTLDEYPAGIGHPGLETLHLQPAVDPQTPPPSPTMRGGALKGKMPASKPHRPVYSRTGDFGHCSLLSGERILKDADQVEASGSIDELNSALGVLVSTLPPKTKWLARELEEIQNSLFKIGALVATNPGSSLLARLAPLSREDVQWLEWAINTLEDQLPAMERFIIPGGHPSAAHAHLARAICRRAERRVIRTYRDAGAQVRPETMTNVFAYLNRLSDFLFVTARWINFLQQVPEKVPERNPKPRVVSRTHN